MRIDGYCDCSENAAASVLLRVLLLRLPACYYCTENVAACRAGSVTAYTHGLVVCRGSCCGHANNCTESAAACMLLAVYAKSVAACMLLAVYTERGGVYVLAVIIKGVAACMCTLLAVYTEMLSHTAA